MLIYKWDYQLMLQINLRNSVVDKVKKLWEQYIYDILISMKQIRFILQCICSVIDQMTFKCGKNKKGAHKV